MIPCTFSSCLDLSSHAVEKLPSLMFPRTLSHMNPSCPLRFVVSGSSTLDSLTRHICAKLLALPTQLHLLGAACPNSILSSLPESKWP